MDVPELTNFGSLLRYAIELEAASAAFYQEAARLLRNGPSADLARRLSQDHEDRRRLLERTRQQKLNEMVLEPISGLDGARYAVDASLHAPGEVGPKAAALERAGALLYGESAETAQSLLTEAARTFRKLGEGNARNLASVSEGFLH